MGQPLTHNIDKWQHPENYPDISRAPTLDNGWSKWDPQYGFAKKRKPLEMKVSWEEMDAVNLPFDQRDYCAHHQVDYLRCLQNHQPFVGHWCGHIKHEAIRCKYFDELRRMMEYERERRLIMREKRKQNSQAVEVS